MRIAIIGSGVSGLVVGHLLHDSHDITIFEADDRIGGHVHTVDVEEDDQVLPVDTGFIVYNERTYPNFCKLLDRIGAETQPSNMSFSVACARTGLEYAGTNLNTLFAQRRNLLRPSFYRMLRDIFRFNREAGELLRAPGSESTTLGDYLAENGYSREFIEQHIIPMGAAIWSADPQQFYHFPARYFVQFLDNHGMLRVTNRPLWRVIRGGSRAYVKRLTAPFRDQILTNTPVAGVRRDPGGVALTLAEGRVEHFDEVVLAVHSNQAVRLLRDASAAEREVLTAIPYHRNEVVLHTDRRMMPAARRAWASWNFHVPPAETHAATVTYDMNLLQTLKSERTYCVTLNRSRDINPAHVIRHLSYDHPVYTPGAVAAQQRHAEISGVNRTHFCGAYWGFGFHEDGVNSALAVGRHFGKGL